MLARLLWERALGLARERGVHREFRDRFPPPAGDVPNTPPAPSEGALGELLELGRDALRRDEFKALIAGTLRADGNSGNATTQRFTPPWLATWLAREGLAARRSGVEPRCLDPACGGGRLLLALYEEGVPPDHMVGVDIDPLAVQVTRWSLWLRARRDHHDPAVIDCRVVEGPLGTLGQVALGHFGLVVSNPPYMGARHLAPLTRDALRERLRPYHGDLYTAFLGRALELCADGGALAFLCQQSFLFVTRDRRLRIDLLNRARLRRVLHLGPHAFPGVQGEKASVVAFTAQVGTQIGPEPEVVDLRDLKSAAAKRDAAGDPARAHRAGEAEERARSGGSFAYWLRPAALRRLRDGPFLGDALDVAGSSNKTAANARFVKRWWEVPEDEIGPGRRWIRYAKGGPFRRFAGNLERVVDWSDEARAHYASHRTANLLPERYWFREGITWSDFGGLRFSARHLPAGCVFDMAGPALFVPDEAPGDLHFWLGLLNTGLVCDLLNGLNPTIHYQVGDLRRLPIPESFPDAAVARVSALTRRAISLVEQVDAWSRPTSPGFRVPRVLTESGDLECRLRDAERWWVQVWRELHGARFELEEAIASLYGLEPGKVGEERPKSPDFAGQARLFLSGQADGRYAATTWPDALVSALGSRRPPDPFKTQWHASRLQS